MGRSIFVVVALAIMLVAAGCGSPAAQEQADVRAIPADDVAGSSGSIEPEESNPSNDGETTQSGGSSDVSPEIPVQRVAVPVVPIIKLPDLSILSEGGNVVEEQLGELVGVGNGLDVVSAECSAEGSEFVYHGSNDDGSFFDVELDGSTVYVDSGGANDIQVTVNPDGSGVYMDKSGANSIVIDVSEDGSGTYRDTSASSDITVEVDGQGYGRFHDGSGSNDLAIEIREDGSGLLVNDGAADAIRVEVKPDGTGSYRNDSGATDILLEGGSDGSWSFRDSSPAIDIELVVNADGSGSYLDKSAATDISITVDSEGNGFYRDDSVGKDLDVPFSTEMGILDPKVLVAGPAPTFAVADRFPPLASLARFEPPCVTIVRLDANVLFDFDSDQLRPEAVPVVESVALTLISTGKSLEVHGHTDSMGSDDYNQDLSERRAQTFTAALVERGVTADIEAVGFGETRPLADNTRPDGSDDPAGRQLNRRIEIVIGE